MSKGMTNKSEKRENKTLGEHTQWQKLNWAFFFLFSFIFQFSLLYIT